MIAKVQTEDGGWWYIDKVRQIQTGALLETAKILKRINTAAAVEGDHGSYQGYGVVTDVELISFVSNGEVYLLNENGKEIDRL